MLDSEETDADDVFNQESEASSGIGCTTGDHFQQCEKSACMIILLKTKGTAQ